MAERERRLARPYGGIFQPRVRVMDADDMARALSLIHISEPTRPY